MAISYPSLLSFEICDYQPWGDELDQGIVGQENVTEIANHTLDLWPLLETLVLSVRGFRYRPRRRDFPNIDDGLDAELKQLALAMFMRHSALNIVALTAIPPKVENPYTIPRRVWKREGDDAVMVGRDAIQWKFDTGRYPKYYA